MLARAQDATVPRLLTNNYREDTFGPIDIDGDPQIAAAIMNTRAIIGHPK